MKSRQPTRSCSLVRGFITSILIAVAAALLLIPASSVRVPAQTVPAIQPPTFQLSKGKQISIEKADQILRARM